VNGIRQPGKRFLGIAVKTQGLEMPRKKGVSGFFHPILRNFRRFIPTEWAAQRITQLALDLLHDNPMIVPPPDSQNGAPVNGQDAPGASGPQNAHYSQNGPVSQFPQGGPAFDYRQSDQRQNGQNVPVEVTFTPMTTVEDFRSLGDALYTTPISVNLIVPFSPKDPKFNKISDLVQSRLSRERPWKPWQLAQAQAGSQTGSQANPQAAYSAQFGTPSGGQSGAQPGTQYGGQSAPGTQFGSQFGGQPPYGSGAPGASPRPQKEPGFTVRWLSIASGKGVNLSDNEGVGTEKGKFYCQVCVLFAIDKQRISPPDPA
jgi:hypothetical protein